MRVSMAAIIHRARWNFNVDEADGVSRRDRMPARECTYWNHWGARRGAHH
jgi:hypothetical protein